MQKELLDNFFKPIEYGAFEVSYWDGTTKQYGEGDPSFKLVFHKQVPYKKIMKNPVDKILSRTGKYSIATKGGDVECPKS